MKFKYYLIRLSDPIRWAYVKTNGNFKSAAKVAKAHFGDNLLAIEPAPVKPRKGREIYSL